MKYVGPAIFTLNDPAASAEGRSPSCIPGSTATDYNESCVSGPAADWACGAGSGVVIGGVVCGNGSAATGGGDCYSGTSVDFYCGTGTSGDVDPTGCDVGPVP